jgi:hypothetical protein
MPAPSSADHTCRSACRRSPTALKLPQPEHSNRRMLLRDGASKEGLQPLPADLRARALGRPIPQLKSNIHGTKTVAAAAITFRSQVRTDSGLPQTLPEDSLQARAINSLPSYPRQPWKTELHFHNRGHLLKELKMPRQPESTLARVSQQLSHLEKHDWELWGSCALPVC